jgi:hypothetical protein
MNQQEKKTERAAYGAALLCNRGGWTLREMLGADYEKFSGTGEMPFTQRDFDQSLGAVSRHVRGPSTDTETK